MCSIDKVTNSGLGVKQSFCKTRIGRGSDSEPACINTAQYYYCHRSSLQRKKPTNTRIIKFQFDYVCCITPFSSSLYSGLVQLIISNTNNKGTLQYRILGHVQGLTGMLSLWLKIPAPPLRRSYSTCSSSDLPELPPLTPHLVVLVLVCAPDRQCRNGERRNNGIKWPH